MTDGSDSRTGGVGVLIASSYLSTTGTICYAGGGGGGTVITEEATVAPGGPKVVVVLVELLGTGSFKMLINGTERHW